MVLHWEQALVAVRIVSRGGVPTLVLQYHGLVQSRSGVSTLVLHWEQALGAVRIVPRGGVPKSVLQNNALVAVRMHQAIYCKHETGAS